MTNRPKQIGTAFETMVVRFLQGDGFPDAERRALAGTDDKGDIVAASQQVIFECKGGKAAESASDAQVEAWMDELNTEMRNSRAQVGVLVVKRKAHGETKVGGMHAYLWLNMDGDGMQLATLGWYKPGPDAASLVARLRLDDAVRLLRVMGYGEPLS